MMNVNYELLKRYQTLGDSFLDEIEIEVQPLDSSCVVAMDEPRWIWPWIENQLI